MPDQPESAEATASEHNDGSPRPTNGAQLPVPIAGRAVLFAILAIVGGATDLLSKQWIFNWRGLPGERDIWWVWEPFFGIETAVNIGAVFGIGAGQGTLFALASVLAAAGIIVWLFVFKAAESLWLTVALGLVGGGIIGNLYDRMGMWWDPAYPDAWRSGVRDWILWRINARLTWPNFNIADSLLVVGACMLLYQSFFMQPVPDSESTQKSDVTPVSDQ
ncbi:signal peptidase II [Stieleria sp. JC731]|uniref:signal peptidase II n=1 Tax=Pirellulaceae TaxID=2691357 RepID=UPI001E602AF0|nr:signal peptidase II [Stieleria sp. JC731]MCC9599699.1 signal peptidase II [Stieleria sp. JC731]